MNRDPLGKSATRWVSLLGTGAVSVSVCSVLFSLAVTGQAPATIALPKFEAVSVKTAVRDGAATSPLSFGEVTGRVTLQKVKFNLLIQRAYGVPRDQVSGPEWFDADLFDVFATVPQGTSPDQIPLMYQSLLIDRFGLKFHRETKDSQVYALVVAEGGPKLEEAPHDVTAEFSSQNKGGRNTTTGEGINGPFRSTLDFATGASHLEFLSMTMGMLARQLHTTFALPVVDRTGLTGRYKIWLDIDMNEKIPQSARGEDGQDASTPAGGKERASLEKQGLKLVSQRASIERLVIDHVERVPTVN